MVYIGERLRELQRQYQLSQDEMADTLCISQSALSKYMNNKAPVPFELVINILHQNRAAGVKLATTWKENFEAMFLKEITSVV